MSRSNKSESEPLRISTSTTITRMLDQVAKTGIMGKNRAEVADRLISDGLRRLRQEGIVDIPPIEGS